MSNPHAHGKHEAQDRRHERRRSFIATRRSHHALVIATWMLLGAPAPANASGGAAVVAARRLEQRATANRDRGELPAAAAGFALAADARFAAGEPPSAIADRLDSLGQTFLAISGPAALAAADSLLQASHAWRLRDPSAADVDLALDHIQLARLAANRNRFASGRVHADSATALLGDGADSTVRFYRAAARSLSARFSFERGDFAAAETFADEALLGLRPDDPAEVEAVIDARVTRGESRRERGRLADAEEDYRAALDLAVRWESLSPGQRPIVLSLLGGLYRDQERWDLAEPLVREALERSRPLEWVDPGRVATAVLNLAETLLHEQRVREALPEYREALSRARACWPPGDPRLIVFLQQAGEGLRQAGQLDAAEPLLREAVAIASQDSSIGPLPRAGAAHALAELLLAQGRIAAADSLARQALRLREARLEPSSRLLAEGHVLLARCALAAAPPETSVARAHAGQALRILGSSPLAPDSRLAALVVLADVAGRDGDATGFEASMGPALDLLDDLRQARGGDAGRAQYLLQALPVLDRAFDHAAASRDLATAFRVHERGRSRVLLENLVAPRPAANGSESGSAPLLARADTLRASISFTQARIDGDDGRVPAWGGVLIEHRRALRALRDSLVLEYDRVRDAVRMRSPDWRESFARSRRLATIEEVLAHARRRHEPVLVYRVGPAGAWLFSFLPGAAAPLLDTLTLAPEPARILRVATGPLDETRLDAILGNGHDAGLLAVLASGSASARGIVHTSPLDAGPSPESRLHALFTALVPARVWDRVRRARTAVVIPDGGLARLPFEALIVASGPQTESPRYWLDEGPALHLAPSATALLALGERPDVHHHGVRPALSLYDVEYRSDRAPTGVAAWPPLPGTALEARRLREALGGSSVDALTGSDATEAALRAALSGRALIHLATHGFTTREHSALLAGLVLARGPQEGRSEDDGLLQSYELPEISLDASLVVLSACETGDGDRLAGEGVLALSRGFLAAGARRVIAALWSVPDDATAELVGTLFEGVAPALRASRTPDTVVALRDAKRSVRRDPRWAAPFAWAAFTLTGKP